MNALSNEVPQHAVTDGDRATVVGERHAVPREVLGEDVHHRDVFDFVQLVVEPQSGIMLGRLAFHVIRMCVGTIEVQIADDHKACDCTRNARLNLLGQFSHAIVAVNSTISSSLKYCATREKNLSDTLN